jgi:2-iminobutanoate/2-iminopropanoate deaminase
MAKRCEPANRPGRDQPRREADSRLHAVPPLAKGRQGGMRQAFSSPNAPKAIGPYASAVRAGELLFISGQTPLDPVTSQMVDGDVAAQTTRVLQSIGALLEAGGLTYAAVVRTTVFLADMDDFAAMNDVYRTFFSEPYPARSTVQAARLPRDARIEIDAIATYGS